MSLHDWGENDVCVLKSPPVFRGHHFETPTRSRSNTRPRSHSLLCLSDTAIIMTVTERTQLYREGGWGWMVVLSAFLSEFILLGTVKALGVLITPIKEEFETDLWIIGSINSLQLGVALAITPVASAIARKVGGRCVITVGGVLCGLGLVLASASTSVLVFAVNIAFLTGSGSAFTLEISRAEMALYFSKRYSVVSFIVYAGGPLAIMIYGPVTQLLMEVYGWRGAMLLIGGVGFFLVWAGVVVRRPRGIYAPVPVQERLMEGGSDDSQSTHQSRFNGEGGSSPGGALVSALGLHIFREVEFLLLAAVRLFFSITLGGILVYIVPNGLAQGLSTTQAAFLTSAYGLGGLAGLVSTSWLGEGCPTTCLHLTALAFIFAAVPSIAFAPFISSFAGQMVNTCVMAGSVHAVVQVASVLTRNLSFPDEDFVMVLGWMGFLSGVATAIGDTLSGWVYGMMQNFQGTFFIYSATMAACGFFIFLDHLRNQRKRSKSDQL